MKVPLQELTISPHIVDCGRGEVTVVSGSGSGAGAGAAEMKLKDRIWSGRTKLRRMLLVLTNYLPLTIDAPVHNGV